MKVWLVQEIFQGRNYIIQAFEDEGDADKYVEGAYEEHPDRTYTATYLEVKMKMPTAPTPSAGYPDAAYRLDLGDNL